VFGLGFTYTFSGIRQMALQRVGAGYTGTLICGKILRSLFAAGDLITGK